MAGLVRERDGRGLRKGKGATGKGKQSSRRQQQRGEGKVRPVPGLSTRKGNAKSVCPEKKGWTPFRNVHSGCW